MAAKLTINFFSTVQKKKKKHLSLVIYTDIKAPFCVAENNNALHLYIKFGFPFLIFPDTNIQGPQLPEQLESSSLYYVVKGWH